jgi:hypothetical protein
VTTTHNADKLGPAKWIVNSLRPEEVRRVMPELKFLT